MPPTRNIAPTKTALASVTATPDPSRKTPDLLNRSQMTVFVETGDRILDNDNAVSRRH